MNRPKLYRVDITRTQFNFVYVIAGSVDEAEDLVEPWIDKEQADSWSEEVDELRGYELHERNNEAGGYPVLSDHGTEWRTWPFDPLDTLTKEERARLELFESIHPDQAKLDV